jgi:hypothetical protein
VLMVSAPEGGSPSTFSYINGRRSWFSSSDTSQGGPSATSSTTKKIQKRCTGKRICWPHLRARYLSRGGPRGHCRYHVDRVPPHTSSKSRRREDVRSHTPTCPLYWVIPSGTGSLGAATPPVALAFASLLGAAQVPSRVPWPQLPS